MTRIVTIRVFHNADPATMFDDDADHILESWNAGKFQCVATTLINDLDKTLQLTNNKNGFYWIYNPEISFKLWDMVKGGINNDKYVMRGTTQGDVLVRSDGLTFEAYRVEQGKFMPFPIGRWMLDHATHKYMDIRNGNPRPADNFPLISVVDPATTDRYSQAVRGLDWTVNLLLQLASYNVHDTSDREIVSAQLLDLRRNFTLSQLSDLILACQGKPPAE